MLKDFSQEKFDIIVMAGQSNSFGCGYGDVAIPYVPNDQVWYLEENYTIVQAHEKVAGNAIQSNFGLSFAQKYISTGRLANDRKLLILRTAAGGTGFFNHFWGLNDPLFLRMKDMMKTALDLNSENRLVAFLWHQGETDAELGADYQSHLANLTALIQNVQSEFHCEDIPFVAADLVQDWKLRNIEICEPVVKAIRDAFCNFKKGAFVNTEGLYSNAQASGNDDYIHFCREAVYQLGIRYFYACTF